jgi:predicted DNA-binding transcriptional regulator AlpA
MIDTSLNSLDASAQDSWQQKIAASNLPHRIYLEPNRVCWVEEGVEAWGRPLTKIGGRHAQ